MIVRSMVTLVLCIKLNRMPIKPRLESTLHTQRQRLIKNLLQQVLFTIVKGDSLPFTRLTSIISKRDLPNITICSTQVYVMQYIVYVWVEWC